MEGGKAVHGDSVPAAKAADDPESPVKAVGSARANFCGTPDLREAESIAWLGRGPATQPSGRLEES
ncbi:hypothetical protein ASAC_0167 [Acidilobus saccharovorans 345-15]|uniref:Uncharacterized protein n=1 Tax=Acidilobus saccharovorans (strain DSM 16705 / JCM 18335 / VKM B-2471 / 345-15) TaxID=666510 RepID=D9PZT7_ACIS3|nr:hypothetical protein ASAC_0167 [Acidilobus saccharovorans 345-15]